MEEVKAKYTFARISPQKVRLVGDQIRGMPVEQALLQLNYSNKKAAVLLKKVLESAIANAENNNSLDIDELKVHTVMIDAGPTLKRMRARAKGRGNKIIKRTSHITLTVA